VRHFVGVLGQRITARSRGSSGGEGDLGFAAVGFVGDDEVAAVAGAELLVGVQELDAGDRAVGGEVDVDLVADADGLDIGGGRAKANLGDVPAGIIGQVHRTPPPSPVRGGAGVGVVGLER